MDHTSRLRRVLRQARQLQAQLARDLENRTFAADDVNMETYNGLVIEAIRASENDPMMLALEVMPDNVLQSFRMFGNIPPNDFPTQRLVSHLNTLINRIENILEDDPVGTIEEDSVDIEIGYSASVLRVFLASPSDVTDEREEACRVIYEWNSDYSYEMRTVLLPVRWRLMRLLKWETVLRQLSTGS